MECSASPLDDTADPPDPSSTPRAATSDVSEGDMTSESDDEIFIREYRSLCVEVGQQLAYLACLVHGIQFRLLENVIRFTDTDDVEGLLVEALDVEALLAAREWAREEGHDVLNEHLMLPFDQLKQGQKPEDEVGLPIEHPSKRPLDDSEINSCVLHRVASPIKSSARSPTHFDVFVAGQDGKTIIPHDRCGISMNVLVQDTDLEDFHKQAHQLVLYYTLKDVLDDFMMGQGTTKNRRTKQLRNWKNNLSVRKIVDMVVEKNLVQSVPPRCFTIQGSDLQQDFQATEECDTPCIQLTLDNGDNWERDLARHHVLVQPAHDMPLSAMGEVAMCARPASWNVCYYFLQAAADTQTKFGEMDDDLFKTRLSSSVLELARATLYEYVVETVGFPSNAQAVYDAALMCCMMTRKESIFLDGDKVRLSPRAAQVLLLAFDEDCMPYDAGYTGYLLRCAVRDALEPGLFFFGDVDFEEVDAPSDDPQDAETADDVALKDSGAKGQWGKRKLPVFESEILLLVQFKQQDEWAELIESFQSPELQVSNEALRRAYITARQQQKEAGERDCERLSYVGVHSSVAIKLNAHGEARKTLEKVLEETSADGVRGRDFVFFALAAEMRRRWRSKHPLATKLFVMETVDVSANLPPMPQRVRAPRLSDPTCVTVFSLEPPDGDTPSLSKHEGERVAVTIFKALDHYRSMVMGNDGSFIFWSLRDSTFNPKYAFIRDEAENDGDFNTWIESLRDDGTFAAQLGKCGISWVTDTKWRASRSTANLFILMCWDVKLSMRCEDVARTMLSEIARTSTFKLSRRRIQHRPS